MAFKYKFTTYIILLILAPIEDDYDLGLMLLVNIVLLFCLTQRSNLKEHSVHNHVLLISICRTFCFEFCLGASYTLHIATINKVR